MVLRGWQDDEPTPAPGISMPVLGDHPNPILQRRLHDFLARTLMHRSFVRSREEVWQILGWWRTPLDA